MTPTLNFGPKAQKNSHKFPYSNQLTVGVGGGWGWTFNSYPLGWVSPAALGYIFDEKQGRGGGYIKFALKIP